MCRAFVRPNPLLVPGPRDQPNNASFCLLRCPHPSLSLHRPDKEMRRETSPALLCSAIDGHRLSIVHGVPFLSFPKTYCCQLHTQAPTPTRPPLPLLLLYRPPRIMAQAPPRPRVGTASSGVSWPPRPPCVCSCSCPTTPTGAAGVRRGVEP